MSQHILLLCTPELPPCLTQKRHATLFNPKTSDLTQKRHPYTGNLNPETSENSKNAFLHCGGVLGILSNMLMWQDLVLTCTGSSLLPWTVYRIQGVRSPKC